MNTIYLIIVLCVLSFSHLFARIRNGYEAQLQSTKISLRKLNLQLLEDKDAWPVPRLQIKSKIENLINYISCYELTQELIRQLKTVSPDIYHEINNIKDKKGRPTDVFVKLVEREKSRIQLKAASFFQQAPTDEDANVSEYGEYSVSVEIWLVDKALFLLAHELGHVKYIIPNLATYSRVLQYYYPQAKVNVSYIGHNRYDQSGKYANIFEKRFLEIRNSI